MIHLTVTHRDGIRRELTLAVVPGEHSMQTIVRWLIDHPVAHLVTYRVGR